MTIPKFLEPGDKVALVAPSSPEPEDRMADIDHSVRSFGLEPVIYPSCYQKRGYLAGADQDRAKDLTDAFADPDIRAVICVRGGYGAHRLMEYLDWDGIAASQKGLYGYSDITALHIEMNRRGVISWHTPMPGEEWYNEMDAFTTGAVRASLFGPFPVCITNPDGAPLKSIQPGRAVGELCGGNLTLVVATLGTSYEIDTRGKILFLEDVDEPPYRVDRMLLQLRHAGKFADCAGIVFGRFTHCMATPGKASLSLDEIINDLLCDALVPVVSGLLCGHAQPTVCLPLGAYALLEMGELKILGV